MEDLLLQCLEISDDICHVFLKHYGKNIKRTINKKIPVTPITKRAIGVKGVH